MQSEDHPAEETVTASERAAGDDPVEQAVPTQGLSNSDDLTEQLATTAEEQTNDDPAEGAVTTVTQPSGGSAGVLYTDAEDMSSAESREVETAGRMFEIIDVVRKDGIPAIFNPTIISADEASMQIRDGDLVIGLSINGDHRAYSVPFLSGHEIVNDVVGGVPVAVTW